MIRKVGRMVIAAVGASLGYGAGTLLIDMTQSGMINLPLMNSFGLFILIFCALLFGIIFFIIAPWIIKGGLKFAQYTEVELEKIPTNQILVGTLGLITGLVIAFLLSSLIRNMIGTNLVFSLLSAITYAFFGYLGVSFATRNIGDIAGLPDIIRRPSSSSKAGKTVSGARPKVLDTSVIIDGRIADICKTQFIEGPLIIPEFVLEELRHIADSSDGLKRNRGRRGLDILKIIQQDLPIEVEIVDTDFEDVSEVDVKLLKLALKINGYVVTNDYNLNKVADLQGVPVLNINELANAVKPIVLPGEEMVVSVVKEGKEMNQGVAYLDDGTMIVVEGGRKHIGETIAVIVTSVLQTAAGRMIFAKPKYMQNKSAG